MREVINNTKNKHTVLSRLLQQTDKDKNIFPDMKNTIIMLNGSFKIHHKQSLTRKEPVIEPKNGMNLDNIFRKKKKMWIYFNDSNLMSWDTIAVNILED